MGIQKVFTSGADLSGISSKQNLQVDAIPQKTFIEVTETGVEAAAATGGEYKLIMRVFYCYDH